MSKDTAVNTAVKNEVDAVAKQAVRDGVDAVKNAMKIADSIQESSATKSKIVSAKFVGHATESKASLIRFTIEFPDDTKVTQTIVVTPNAWHALKASNAKSAQKIRFTHNNGKGYSYSPLTLRQLAGDMKKLGLPYQEIRSSENPAENSKNEYERNMATLRGFIDKRFAAIQNMAAEYEESKNRQKREKAVESSYMVPIEL